MVFDKWLCNWIFSWWVSFVIFCSWVFGVECRMVVGVIIIWCRDLGWGL